MINAIMQVRKAHKAVLENTYEDSCTIKEYKPIKDPVTKATKNEEVIVLENQPCKLVYKNVTSTSQTGSNAITQQEIKLLIAPEIEVKEGSKIFVTHEEITKEYKHSGIPAVYSSHQEIVLELVGNA